MLFLIKEGLNGIILLGVGWGHDLISIFFSPELFYMHMLCKDLLCYFELTESLREMDVHISMFLSGSLFLCVSLPIYIFFNLCLSITMFLSLSICNSVSLHDTLSLWLPSLVLYLGPEKVLYPGILVTSQRQIWQPILPGSIALLENKEPAVSHQGIINSKLVTQLHSFFFYKKPSYKKVSLKKSEN